ncbi:hypothetical protein IMAU10031_01262 [Lactobacillus helveticus]|nr:hypothetical protein [Lactobacillus helveticus]NRO76397.1 hypothetical protein [Lactobacillus helveticus]
MQRFGCVHDADFLTDELGLTSLGLVNHQHHYSMKKQALNLNGGLSYT